ncbi:hypothetical protein DFJ73DRAFT_966175 [Zopfochytrium polystomum]|nr:hypothetical protein DFJ73DRAFT_966175 [Zopfochytrium polystomum]
MKRLLRFQEESREREAAFRGAARSKRTAFRVGMARLEQRQEAERKELLMAQQRLIHTRQQIQAIELAAVQAKDPARAALIRKDNEKTIRQSQMRQHKEVEFLRELQLRKARHLSELNELNILHAEEIEDLRSQHAAEEFELLAKQSQSLTAHALVAARKRSDAEAVQLESKQRMARVQMQRAQRRQAGTLARAQRAGVRLREKLMIAENPIIRGTMVFRDGEDATTGAGDGDIDGLSDRQSSVGSRSQLSETSSTWTEEQQLENLAAGGDARSDKTGGAEEPEGGEQKEHSEALVNTMANRGEGTGLEMSEEQRESSSIEDQARESLRIVLAHHKTTLDELRSSHKHQLSLKKKEHHRKLAEILKEHKDEIESLKQDQNQLMEDLLASQEASIDNGSEDLLSSIVGTMALPEYVIRDINAGRTPQAVWFETATVFCVEVPILSRLADRIEPSLFFETTRAVAEKIERVVSRQEYGLFRIESALGTWLLAAGLTEPDAVDKAGALPVPGPTSAPDGGGSGEHTSLDAASTEQTAGSGSIAASEGGEWKAIRCVEELMELAFEDCLPPDGWVADEPVRLRIGMATGRAVGGIVSAAKSNTAKYTLVGEAVDMAVQLCRSTQLGTVNLSLETQQLIG